MRKEIEDGENMRKRTIILLTLVTLSSLLGIPMTIASEQAGGLANGETGSVIIPESVVPESLEYVEGLNDDQPVYPGRTYAADWFGFKYIPSVSYDLKLVELMAGSGGGEFIVQLRADDAGWPSDVVLRETSFIMSDTLSWQGSEFPESYPVNAGIPYWIVFKPVPSSIGSTAESGTIVTHVFDYGGDGWDGIVDMFPWMAKFYKETVEWDYAFQLSPFSDIVHLNYNPDGWLNGINEAGYVAPVLGKHHGKKAYIACDLPAGGIEMYFLVITPATMTGEMYRIWDDLSLTGPDAITLIPVAAGAEGETADEASGAKISPESMYTFQMNPFIDLCYIYDDLKPWLWGYQDVVGFPGYPAPVLGYAIGSRFYWAADFVDGHGGYELLFLAGSIPTRDGNIIRTVDGYSYDGPTYVWLTPAGVGETYKGALAEID
jgi:hypothetical protein